jgi:hypothetical protein
MAVTVTPAVLGDDRYQLVGRERVVRRRLALSGTYATGGFSLTANAMNLNRIDWVQFHGPASNGTNLAFPWWDEANGKVELYTAYNTEFTNTGSVASYTIDVTVGGK